MYSFFDEVITIEKSDRECNLQARLFRQSAGMQ